MIIAMITPTLRYISKSLVVARPDCAMVVGAVVQFPMKIERKSRKMAKWLIKKS
jgi:hypothetical protein